VTPLLSVLLFLHVITAIVAFGPGFAFPLIGGLAGKHPQHAGFAVEAFELIEKRMTLPLALTMPVTGVAMILVAGINPLVPWLAIAIVLYVIALGYAILVQNPTVAELVGEMRGMAMAGPGAASASEMAGPPPKIAALTAKTARGGQILSLLVVAIVFLMVTKIGA